MNTDNIKQLYTVSVCFTLFCSSILLHTDATTGDVLCEKAFLKDLQWCFPVKTFLRIPI